MRKLLAIFAILFSYSAYAADNSVVLTPGSGVTMRTQDVGSGVQSPYNILGNTSGTSIYGTAGTSNAAVLSVQGIASGTALPVSLTSTTITGTVTATVSQATAANLNATVVGTGTFATQAAQSGTWNITNISGTISLPTGASTVAKQPALGTAGTASTDVITIQGIASMTPLLATVTATNLSSNISQINAVTPLMGNGVTGTGSLRVTVSSDNTAFSVNAAQLGTWNITNISGTISLPTLAATSTKQSDGSQKTQIVDGSGNVIAATSNALNVQCANCSGSGVSTADEATFTAGTSLFAGSGGFFQTTATNNALTNGQQGMLQMTANRAAFVNLRNTAGTEIGTSTTEIFVGGRGTAGTAAGGVLTIQGVASMTKLLVTPDSVALPANQSVNLSQVNAVTVLTGTGAVGTGSQRIAVGTDTATIAGSAPGTAGTASSNVITVQGVASMTKLLVTPDSVALPANQSVNISQINAVTPLMGNGVTGTGSQRVTIASDNTAFAVNSTLSAETTKVIGTVNIAAAQTIGITANSSVNVAQINGVTTLMGNGVTGTGSQRVTIASDNTAFSVNATLSAETTKVVGTVRALGNAGAAFDAATGAAPPANAVYVGANTSGATGGLIAGLIQCDSTAIYDASTSGSTELVALTSGRTIYVCGYSILNGGTATNIKLIYGTGTACATGSTNMTPAYQLIANAGIVDGGPLNRGLKTASANALCLNTSAGNAAQAIVYYAKL